MTSANRYALGVLSALSLIAAGAACDLARADGTFFKHKPPAAASGQQATGSSAPAAPASRTVAGADRASDSARSPAPQTGAVGQQSPQTSLPPEVQGVVSQVVSTDTLIVAGQRVRLEGLRGSPTLTGPFRQWLARQGGQLRCKALGTGYRCATAAGQDVGLVLILNGAAECASGAPPEYQMAQQQARQARRGLWAN